MSRRWRFPRVARGRVRWVPPAAIQPPPRWLDQAGWRPRWPQVRLRRGRFFEPVRTVAAPAPPVFVPPFVRRAGPRLVVRRRAGQFLPPPEQQLVLALRPVRGRAALPIRRARFFWAPWPEQPAEPPPTLARARVRLAVVRRARFTLVPWPEQVVPPRLARARPFPAGVRRGRFFTVPWPEPDAEPPPWVPTSTRPRVKLLWRSRKGWWAVVPETVAPPTPPTWVPAFTSSARTTPGPPRRGRFSSCPPSSAQPLAPMTRARPHLGYHRRGAFTEPPWTTAPPADAPPWIPDALGRHRTPAFPPRRGRCFAPAWPQAEPPEPPLWVPPAMVGRRPRPPVRRGRFTSCPLVGSAPVVVRAIHADITGPAIRPVGVAGPALDPNTPTGPATARQVTGPAVSRTVSGIGV